MAVCTLRPRVYKRIRETDEWPVRTGTKLIGGKNGGRYGKLPDHLTKEHAMKKALDVVVLQEIDDAWIGEGAVAPLVHGEPAHDRMHFVYQDLHKEEELEYDIDPYIDTRWEGLTEDIEALGYSVFEETEVDCDGLYGHRDIKAFLPILEAA